uniref:Uncharacterized protein n=1 Tax=Oryza meridionalis TaxID=40149 RepID=A0A0E0C8A6_9ORYZ
MSSTSAPDERHSKAMRPRRRSDSPTPWPRATTSTPAAPRAPTREPRPSTARSWPRGRRTRRSPSRASP